MEQVFFFLLFFLALALGYCILRWAGKWDWLIFLLVPLFLLPTWLGNQEMTFFKWVKIISVLVGAFLILLARYSREENRSLLSQVFIAIVGLNILEASVATILHWDLHFLLSAITGLMLIPLLWKRTEKSSNVTKYDLLYPYVDWRWIIGYTLWNLSFILLLYPLAFFKHVLLLLIPIAAEKFVKGSWLQARTYSLALYLMIIFSFDHFLRFDLSVWTEFSLFVKMFSLISFGYLVFLSLSESSCFQRVIKKLGF